MTATLHGPVAIELDGVTKTFEGSDSAAVAELTLSIPSGELVVFVGPSGCGKTTTLRMINGLERPTSGIVSIDGQDISRRDTTDVRREMGYVIQQVGLFPHRTVRANIATVPKLLGWSRDRIANRIDELVELMDLEPSVLDRYPAALSGGQQQRVGVARALAADPPILLMDEPYSAVDPVVRAKLQRELIDLHRRLGTTIVMVTHDIDEAIIVADRIAVFAAGGHLAQYATPDSRLANPADEFVAEFLGEERSLRRLGLAPLKSVALRAVGADTRGLPQLDLDATARQALDLLLSSGEDQVVVTRAGQVLGVVGLAELTGVLDQPT